MTAFEYFDLAKMRIIIKNSVASVKTALTTSLNEKHGETCIFCHCRLLKLTVTFGCDRIIDGQLPMNTEFLFLLGGLFTLALLFGIHFARRNYDKVVVDEKCWQCGHRPIIAYLERPNESDKKYLTEDPQYEYSRRADRQLHLLRLEHRRKCEHCGFEWRDQDRPPWVDDPYQNDD